MIRCFPGNFPQLLRLYRVKAHGLVWHLEDSGMWHPTLGNARTSPLLLGAVVASGLFFAGCDEHVDVVRDHSVVIPKHATWAWRPDTAEKKDKEGASQDVISRDVISDDGRSETISRDPRSDNETLRLAIRTDIEQEMRSKGFKQVDSPAAAEFLADYHFAIRRHTAAEGASYREGGYRGGYPGFVCGPFGCWASYTWGYWGGPYGYRNPNYREGTIVFDFVKQSSNKVAFRAVGRKELNHESFSTDRVRDAVHRLLGDLKHGKD
jgi:hypothetical protein